MTSDSNNHSLRLLNSLLSLPEVWRLYIPVARLFAFLPSSSGITPFFITCLLRDYFEKPHVLCIESLLSVCRQVSAHFLEPVVKIYAHKRFIFLPHGICIDNSRHYSQVYIRLHECINNMLELMLSFIVARSPGLLMVVCTFRRRTLLSYSMIVE